MVQGVTVTVIEERGRNGWIQVIAGAGGLKSIKRERGQHTGTKHTKTYKKGKNIKHIN